MNRGEHTDGPGAEDPGAAGPPGDLPARPAPDFTVVISGDGSAAVDGEPVRTEAGESVDAAVLDRLHRHAVDRDSTVTAAVTDPSAGHVTYVEVAPDGSSRLLEQPEQPERQPEPAPAAVAPGPTAVRRTRTRTRTRQSDDEYEPARLLERPLVIGPVALLVAGAVIVPLVMLGSGGSDDGEPTGQAARATAPQRTASPSPRTAAPTVSVSPSVSSLSPSPSPTKPKAKPKPTPKVPGGAGGEGGAGGATVTVRPPKATTTVTAKPPAETAATAVKRLARNDPSGRHICYRAYVSGRGWQKPVCDGTVAGTTGQNLPIKALNIAVSGTGGTAANAFVHNPRSTDGAGIWQPKWTPNTADGKNIYIGSAKRSAPSMLGFAINIGSGGRICQAAHVQDTGWSETGCADPRPDFVTGGSFSNDRWLEAVKFTV
ncbi:hypothetical protein [Streptomyces sp. CAI-85]|uniref:hypothetical protein n=1 Tax=Streptomyces sp. CAI-85 TaxID=1472662 RepID=UPI001587E7B8|nr:hypothetical protein [Streptomyces sp. CAI-85]NUV62119.1 hypothetical protein [Streptomyces sp. CAI-85]